MRNTTLIGDISAAKLASALVQAGAIVSFPLGNSHRYDLVMDVDDRLFKVQCKTGRLEEGFVEFNAHSVTFRAGGVVGTQDYRGQVDYFAVYCPAIEACYLVPVEDVGTSNGILRVVPTRNGQAKGIRWARDYELERVIEKLKRPPASPQLREPRAAYVTAYPA